MNERALGGKCKNKEKVLSSEVCLVCLGRKSVSTVAFLSHVGGHRGSHQRNSVKISWHIDFAG